MYYQEYYGCPQDIFQQLKALNQIHIGRRYED